jgi:exosortase/archaeosortase family protein
VLLFIALRAALISFILLIYKGTVHHVLLVWLDPTIFIAMLVIGLYIVKQNNILNRLYISLNFQFSEIITTSLSSLVLLLILLPPLPRVLFNYIHSDIMPGIVSYILYFSKIFLGWMGKTAEVSGRFITLENNWIDLEYPCLGLGIFTLIAILIFAIKGKILNKVIYLLFFALVYLLLNALRLSVLLLYINNTYHQIGLNKLELHNNATYFMYVVAFCGFWGYWVGVRNNNFK